MSSRSVTFARMQTAFFVLLVLVTVAISLSIDLSKFQERVSTEEAQAILQGISSRSQLETALNARPSNNVLQLMSKALRVADDTRGAIDQLSAQIEPAR